MNERETERYCGEKRGARRMESDEREKVESVAVVALHISSRKRLTRVMY